MHCRERCAFKLVLIDLVAAAPADRREDMPCPAMQGAALQANGAIETLHAATRSGTVSLAQAPANVDRCRLAMHSVSSEPEQGALTRSKQAGSGQRK